MILRELGVHIRAQDWWAVALELVIVVVGVFIGIEVSNWNEARAGRTREALLLNELRAEAQSNSAFARSVGDGLNIGAASARRVLRLAESRGDPCPQGCWTTIVDLMHASQWQQILANWTTYEELRRAGLPSDRRIVEAVEAYRQASHRAAQALETPPVYRTLVRRLIPIELQDEYWAACFTEAGSIEIYADPCPSPAGLPPIEQAVAERILADREVMASLREWTSIARQSGNSLTTLQQDLAAEITQAIDRSSTP